MMFGGLSGRREISRQHIRQDIFEPLKGWVKNLLCPEILPRELEVAGAQCVIFVGVYGVSK